MFSTQCYNDKLVGNNLVQKYIIIYHRLFFLISTLVVILILDQEFSGLFKVIWHLYFQATSALLLVLITSDRSRTTRYSEAIVLLSLWGIL